MENRKAQTAMRRVEYSLIFMMRYLKERRRPRSNLSNLTLELNEPSKLCVLLCFSTASLKLQALSPTKQEQKPVTTDGLEQMMNVIKTA